MTVAADIAQPTPRRVSRLDANAVGRRSWANMLFVLPYFAVFVVLGAFALGLVFGADANPDADMLEAALGQG